MSPNVVLAPSVATVLVGGRESSQANLCCPDCSTFDLGMSLGLFCLFSSCLSETDCLLCGPYLLHAASEAGGCALRFEAIAAFTCPRTARGRYAGHRLVHLVGDADGVLVA
jgi:hypothetical protein